MSASISPWMVPPFLTSMNGISGRIENIAGGDHVRAAELYDAIPVGDGVRLIEDFYQFTVVVFLSPFFQIGIRGDHLVREVRGLHAD